MTAAYDQVVTALPHLTPEERTKIAERLKMLQSLTPGSALAAVGGFEPAARDDVAEELLAAICAAVFKASGERASPGALRRVPQFRSFKEKAAALEPFLNKSVPARTERRALLGIAAELLYDVIQEEGHPASARTLMAQVHRLPSVLDAQFPGYAACGLLRMVVRSTARAGSGG